ncbi:MAG: hypothetical protein JXR76_03750 [Deltaproteobacteria bacterium]|nr:hypothetical protein [Deltaproteobacteria bacterium]
MTTQNMIQITVEGQEVTGAVKKRFDNQVEVEMLSPYSGHKTSTWLPAGNTPSQPAKGYMYLMRDLLEDLYLQCRWDPAS